MPFREQRMARYGGRPHRKQNAMKQTPRVLRNATIRSGRTTADTYVVGGGALGIAVARRLLAEDQPVVLVDDVPELPDVPTYSAEPTDIRSLAKAGLHSASTVIVAGPSDAQNLLVAQLVKVRFDVDRIIVLTNHPDRAKAMSDGGIDAFCVTTALSDALVDSL